MKSIQEANYSLCVDILQGKGLLSTYWLMSGPEQKNLSDISLNESLNITKEHSDLQNPTSFENSDLESCGLPNTPMY